MSFGLCKSLFEVLFEFFKKMSGKELKTQEVKVKPSPGIVARKEKKLKTDKIEELKKKEPKTPIVTKETKVQRKKIIKETKTKVETKVETVVEEVKFYLPPLEEEIHDTYTLVLDLDETLVHYVEVTTSIIKFSEHFLDSRSL